MTTGPLAGVGVLVTRPVHQAKALSRAIEESGGRAVAFPVFDIVPREEAEVDADAANLPPPDISVFVSSNAVRHGLRPDKIPAGRVAAIGPTTRAAIAAVHADLDVLTGESFNSESLLAVPELRDVGGLNIRIVRGEGGRGLLGDTLKERGAVVNYLEVYRRRGRTCEDSEVLDIDSRWRQGEIDIVTIMSVATLQFLLDILPAATRERLRQTRLVTPSDRVIQTASELLPGSRATLAPGPGPADMVSAMVACHEANPDDEDE